MDSLSGEIIGDAHHLRVRIYYEDTDFSGVVYHANYLKYFERGRTEYMRMLGVHHHHLAALDEPLAFAVAEINVRYRAPARIDELITVQSRLVSARGASFVIDQAIVRGDVLLATARLHVVCIDGQGRPKRLDRALMDVLKSHATGENNG